MSSNFYKFYNFMYNLEELQKKHPEYASLVADTEFILMWFKT